MVLEQQIDRADWSVALLSYDDFSFSVLLLHLLIPLGHGHFVFFVGFGPGQVVLLAVNEHYDIRILLDRT